METLPNNPAFPMDYSSERSTQQRQMGMDIRTYISTKAMQGLIANAPDGHLGNSREGVELAVTWADVLIEELNKEK